MKHKGKNDELFKTQREREIGYFLFMCGEEDANFFSVPDRKRKTDDYVRLMLIALVFNLPAPMMRILKEAEEKKRDKEVLKRMEELKDDRAVIVGWVDEFVEKIRNEEVKEIALQYWNEKKENFEKNGEFPR